MRATAKIAAFEVKDVLRSRWLIGYALFFILFALLLERMIFERLERRTFKWRPKLSGIDVVEDDFQDESDFQILERSRAKFEALDADGSEKPRG